VLRAATATKLVNIEDVEIVQTGIEYPLSTGPATFTVEDLADAVEAQGDPAVKAPRLKLGHVANLGLLEDGQPAIGTVGNLRLEQDGHLLVGDYIGVPEWLADILPSAYPARSIEAVTHYATNTGHQWRLIITDLALLGVVWPGVGTLEDIEALYSKEGPDNITVFTTKEEVEAGMPRTRAGLKAAVDAETIRRGYYEQLGSDQFWWWIRSMYLDPNELIVEDEEDGSLYRVPFETKGDKVEFKDPIAVKIVYKDKPSSEQPEKSNAAIEYPGRAVLAAYPDRAHSRPDATNNERETTMSTIASSTDPAALRNALGLEESATDDEVKTALAAAGFIDPPNATSGEESGEAGSEQPGTTSEGPTSEQPNNTAPGGPNDPATAQPTVEPDAGNGQPEIRQPVAATTGADGFVRLDPATFERLNSAAQRGEQAFQAQLRAERDGIIETAIRAGKIPPSRRSHWESMWDRDTEGTRTLLTASAEQGGLAAGLVPVKESGGTPQDESLGVEAYPAHWLPEISREG
jgi:hypothetical protein